MNKLKHSLGPVCEVILDKKGEDVLVLDVRKISSFTDFFIICHGLNQKQNQAISDGITLRLKAEQGRTPAHVEGYEQADWILIDYLDFVIHIFSERARQFYKLEKLWGDAVELEPAALIA